MTDWPRYTLRQRAHDMALDFMVDLGWRLVNLGKWMVQKFHRTNGATGYSP